MFHVELKNGDNVLFKSREYDDKHFEVVKDSYERYVQSSFEKDSTYVEIENNNGNMCLVPKSYFQTSLVVFVVKDESPKPELLKEDSK